MSVKSNFTRREFCHKSCKSLAFVCAAHLIKPGKIFSVPISSNITLNLTDSANFALLQTGGAIYVTNPQDSLPLIIVRVSSTEVTAFSSRCTHQGCLVGLPKNGVAVCPCHSSTFNNLGKVTGGPASLDLEAFSAILDGDIITISNIDSSVEKKNGNNIQEPFTINILPGSVVLTRTEPASTWGVNVYNTAGQTLEQWPNLRENTITWSNARVPSGVYFISVHINSRKFLKRITVIN